MLHPAHTTSVTIVAPRLWRPYLLEAAGTAAFPAEAPGDHLRFRLRGCLRTVREQARRFDTWHFCMAPPAVIVQQSLLSM